MSPSIPLAALLATACGSLADDESSMLQMPIMNEALETDLASSECRCPGYYQEECNAEWRQGCVWSDEGDSNGPWCQCLNQPTVDPELPIVDPEPPVAEPPAVEPPAVEPPNIHPEPETPVCCMALTASCLACGAAVTVEEFCTGSPGTMGCADLVDHTDAASPLACSDHCFQLEPLELFDSEIGLSDFSMQNNNTEWSLIVGDLTYSARLSPWQDTTLQSLDSAYGLSGDNSVAQVAWAYPDPQGTASVVEQPDNFMRFLRTGGFIYLNSASDVVAIKSLAPMQGGLQDLESQFTLSFEQANEITQDQVSEACPGGMNPITLGNLYDAGARQYCWAFQHKLGFCDHGCFLYQMIDGYVGFAVLGADMVARTDAGNPVACSDHCFELEPLELFESEVALSDFSIDNNGVEWSLIFNNQTFSSRLTPWHSVTLEALDIAYGLSGNNVVAQVAWAYPDPQGTASVVEQADNFMRFLRTGGFVYLNSAGEVVAIKSLAPMVGDERDPEAQFVLSFEQSVEITQDELSQACPSGMNPITLGNLYDAGARQYCWAFQDSLSICDHGCFLYHLTDGYVGFAVMGGGLQ